MFDSKYYKKKYVFTDKRDISTLVELNESRSEYYAFIPRNGGTNYYVVLRDLNDESFNNGNLSTLKDFLVSNCTDEKEFDDCFKRTRRIVSKIYRINLRKMSEEKVKKYSKTID